MCAALPIVRWRSKSTTLGGQLLGIERGSALPDRNDEQQYEYDELRDYARQSAEQHGIPGELLLRQITAESNWNPAAVSPAGAMGLLQLMPTTAEELGVSDPFNPYESIRAGAQYMGQLLRRYNGDIVRALVAYNWGMGNLQRKGLLAMPEETRRYVEYVAGVTIRDSFGLMPGESVTFSV